MSGADGTGSEHPSQGVGGSSTPEPRRRILSSRLLRRIALALLLVGVAPLVVAAWLMVRVSRSSLEEEALNTHVSAAHLSASRLDQQLRSWRTLLAGAAADPRLLEDPSGGGPSEVLRSVLSGLGHDAAVALVTDDGGLVLRAQRGEAAEPLAQALLAAGREEVSIVPADDSGRALRLRVRVPGSDGWLVLALENEVLAPALEPLQQISWGNMALVEPTRGPIVGELDRAWIEDPAGLETVDSNYREIEGTSIAFDGSTQVEGMVGAYSGLVEAPWYVLSQRPREEVFETTGSLLRNTGLALAVAAVLTLLLSGAAYSSLVEPLQEVVRAQRALLGQQTARTGDEIADLRSVFRELEERIRQEGALDQVLLDRYQVQSILGRGAMGIVFRGWDLRLERPVALKTIRLDQEIDEHLRTTQARRLIDEAITVAKLNDPHIVQVYDVQTDDEAAFITMELIDGPSLARYLTRHGPLSSDQTIGIGLAIARALDAAHRADIVHQDIKPANVLLTAQGRVKVVDFGIASLMSQWDDEEGVSGTPGYLAPEILDGEPPGPPGDLFALGAVMYQCLSGKAPFRGRNLSETIRRTLDGEFLSLAECAPDAPPELRDLIERLLARDPSDRLDDAAAVIARLEALAEVAEASFPDLVDAGDEEHRREVAAPTASQSVRSSHSGSAS